MSDYGSTKAQRIHLPAALLCFATLVSACGSEPLTSTARPKPVPGCENLDLIPCDTLTTGCQQSRLELAACLRETYPGRLPTVNVLTEQEYVDYARALYEGTEFPVTNHFEVAMTWLGLSEPGSFAYVPVEKENITDWFGTYRWRQKDVLIVDHGTPADDAASNVALVAALIRSLRDRDIDIGAWTTVVSVFDLDSNWGADAMYFGEARFYSNRYQAALDGLDPSHFDEFALINQGIREDITWIRSQPSPYVATNLRFANNFGARASYLAWRRGGVDAVNALYEGKLLTHQLMASETEEAPAPPLKYHGLPRAADEWQYDPTTTAIGAWGLFLSLSRNLDEDVAWSLALDWRGDQLFVYRGAEPNESETALVWQLEMADEESAASLLDALKADPTSPQVQRTGTFLTLAIASNQAPLEWAFVSD